MKIPRNISGAELAKLLSAFGYEVALQKGSHIKVTTQKNGEHHLAIPNHNPIKIGTLNAILRQVSEHFEISKDGVMSRLFS